MFKCDKDLLVRGIISANRVLRPVDTLFKGKTDETTQPAPLFILGTPRSGTTLTYQLITQQLRVGYMTAPVNYLHGLSNLLTRILLPCLGRPTLDFDSKYGSIRGVCAPGEYTHYWYQWFPHDGELGHYVNPDSLDIKSDSYEVLRQSINSMSSILQRPMVFKNLYLTMAAGALARIFPDARFLIVQRDPLLVCQSLLRGRMSQLDSKRWWSVKPPYYREWLTLPIWQQVARQVFFTEYYLRQDLSRYAEGRVMTISYADLCREPKSHLDRIRDWLLPMGYESYPDSTIPSSFTVSESLTMESGIEGLIRDELNFLGEVNNAT